MKRSDGYWERRAAERMYEDMERAEGVADQIADVYQKTAVYLTGQAKKVFDKFRREYGLTEKQAKALLDKARNRKDLDKLLHELSTRAVTDEEKDAIYRILEAPAYAARISRLEDLLQQVDHVMGDAYKQEVSLNRDFYIQLAKDAYYHTVYDIQQRAGAAFSFAYVSRKQINNTLQMPWSGKNYSTRIWDNTQKLADILKTEMVVSLITGRTDRETTKVIQEAMGSGAMQSRRLVRTEAAHVSSDFTLRSYKECGIENYRYVAILDLKTSEICRELDGREFPVDEAKTGVNYPPMHPWCRSTTIAAPTPEQLKTMKRRARDPVTGKQMLVPMAMTYKEWYAEYVEGKAEAETVKNKIKNMSTNIRQFDGDTRRKDVLERARLIKSESDLKAVSESSIIKMQSVEEITKYFKQQYGIDVNGFDGKEILGAQSPLVGYDDMLQEFPELQGKIKEISYNYRISANGDINLGTGKSRVGKSGLYDYGTGVHESAHMLDHIRSAEQGCDYAAKIVEQARKNLKLRKNSKDYKNLRYDMVGFVGDQSVYVNPKELFAFGIETAKGRIINSLAKEIYRLVKEG